MLHLWSSFLTHRDLNFTHVVIQVIISFLICFVTRSTLPLPADLLWFSDVQFPHCRYGHRGPCSGRRRERCAVLFRETQSTRRAFSSLRSRLTTIFGFVPLLMCLLVVLFCLWQKKFTDRKATLIYPVIQPLMPISDAAIIQCVNSGTFIYLHGENMKVPQSKNHQTKSKLFISNDVFNVLIGRSHMLIYCVCFNYLCISFHKCIIILDFSIWLWSIVS